MFDISVITVCSSDDRYKDDTEKTNIAEIIVEKHRNGPTGKIELYFDEQKTTFLDVEKSNFGDLEEVATSANEEF